MQRRTLAAATVAVALLLGAAPAAVAMPSQPSAAFGEHVSSMAPDCPLRHGAMFGRCVSAMASTGQCPHHDGMMMP